MKAAVISIGDELTSGQTVDSNSAWISAQLLRHGVATAMHLTVPDQLTDIRDALLHAAGLADLLIVTGGLGPTADDLTRQGLAAAMGADLVLDAGSLARIEAFFAARGRAMNPSNRAQAMLPAGAGVIDNPLGTAPGIRARLGRSEVFVMPGVPSEMKGMFARAVEPILAGRVGATAIRVAHTFGQGESDVGARLADLMGRRANPRVGTTVADGMVSVRIVAHGADPAAAAELSQRTLDEVRRRLGSLVVGVDGQTMAGVVGELLRARGQTLATAESCTGGLVGELVTAVPGSSDYYLGGVIAYANQAKVVLLGVEADLIARHGAVSEPVAAALAEGARRRLGATWALSVTGIAGPGGGSAEKPVGLVYVALSGTGGTLTWRLLLPGQRDMVRLRSALSALDKLRLALLEAT